MVYLGPTRCIKSYHKSPHRIERTNQLVGEPGPCPFWFPSLDLDHQLSSCGPSTPQSLESGKELPHRPSTIFKRGIQFLHDRGLQTHQAHSHRSTPRFAVRSICSDQNEFREEPNETPYSPDPQFFFVHFLTLAASTSLTSMCSCIVSVRSLPVCAHHTPGISNPGSSASPPSAGSTLST